MNAQVERLGDHLDYRYLDRAVEMDPHLSLQELVGVMRSRVSLDSPSQCAVDARSVSLYLTCLISDLSQRYFKRDTTKLKPPMSPKEAKLLLEAIQLLNETCALLLSLERAALNEALRQSEEHHQAIQSWLKRVEKVKQRLMTPSYRTGLFVSRFPETHWQERVKVFRKVWETLRPYDYRPAELDANERVVRPAFVKVPRPLQRLTKVPLPW